MNLLDQLLRRNQPANPRSSAERLVRAGLLQLIVFVGGTLGYYGLTEEFSLLDCAYMTVITVTTVGYDESIPIDHDPVLQIFTIFLVIIGMGAVLYFVSVLAAFMIEGELRDLFRRRRMDRQIENLAGHFIIAGLGRTGRNLAKDIIEGGNDCVVIDQDQDKIDEFISASKDMGVPFLVADATDDDVLTRAGIKRATGVAFCLGDDRENLFATISAHRLNESARIVTRGDDPRSEEKFLMAGASRVVYINNLGGRHMAAELVRPQITNFLSLLFAHPERDHDIDKVHVPSDSPLIGKTLEEIDLRRHTNALIIAIIDPDGENHFSPSPQKRVEADVELVILAKGDEFVALKSFVETGVWSL